MMMGTGTCGRRRDGGSRGGRARWDGECREMKNRVGGAGGSEVGMFAVRVGKMLRRGHPRGFEDRSDRRILTLLSQVLRYHIMNSQCKIMMRMRVRYCIYPEEKYK